MKYQVLFVCLGNICRSPAGENIFRHAVKQAGLLDQITIDSAGTIGFHRGKAPDERMAKTLRSRQIQVSGSSRPIEKEDLLTFDLILTMDEENYRDVCALTTEKATLQKVRHFVEFCENYEDTHVPDPYYGGDEGFEHVADLIEDGVTNLLLYIKQQMAASTSTHPD